MHSWGSQEVTLALFMPIVFAFMWGSHRQTAQMNWNPTLTSLVVLLAEGNGKPEKQRGR
jgi:hypothetical protein